MLAGRCRLADARRDGARRDPDCARGARDPHRVGATWATAPARLVAELSELEAESDFVLVDAGSGLGPGVPMLAAAADEVVIVSTPEPTSLADAHAAIGRFRRLPLRRGFALLVNQARLDAGGVPKCSTDWSPRAGSSWARSSRRWARVRFGPIPMCRWPSAAAGRS